MANFDSYENSNNMRQKDLVLAPNEYVFVQHRTNGAIRTYTGPAMITISQQEALVIFDSVTKQFKEIFNFDQAKQLFVSAPENWYVILKNPSANDTYPEAGKAAESPKLRVGEKVNIKGPVTFSLYPGQMAKVVRGHSLRTNQYLLARVYEAEAASAHDGEILDTEGNKVQKSETYVNGQILIIKGTEVSFYIPPTGIEVIPVDNNPAKGYIREAVTLERLEYCILKDENGSKTYAHGPAVVFPKPTETFVTMSKGGYIFRAIELSKISGLYVKVIAEYTDEDNKVHPVGEELFITGDDQMIYYPRPEHAIINYDNKIMHHAIAIPEGEGRYIMNRLTGEIKTIKGPKMYLPDPRTEVVIKRKLTDSQCHLWYPGNLEALEYNRNLSERAVEKGTSKSISPDEFVAYLSCNNSDGTLASLESKANISRGTSYTKPRTITLDNKYDGVVSVDVWTGYAVNVVSKSGDRKVVCGPQTVLLDYDQTLEVMTMSTGRPKTTDNVIKTVYLRHENNKVSDLINVETKDFVRAEIKVSYCVNFDQNAKDKWFNVENYVKYLCDRERSLIKKAAKNYTIEDFYQNYSTIVHDVAVDAGKEHGEGAKPGMYFPENGMYVTDVEVLSIRVEPAIEKMLLDHQHNMVRKTLELKDAQRSIEITEALAVAEEKEQELRNQQLLNKLALDEKEASKKLEIQAAVNRQKEVEQLASVQAKADLQVLLNAVTQAEEAREDTAHKADLARRKETQAQEIEHARQLAEIEKAKQEAYAKTVADIMASVSPDLVAALTAKSNNAMLETVTKAMSPYAIAQGESVAEVTNKLLRGTSLENLIDDVNINVGK